MLLVAHCQFIEKEGSACHEQNGGAEAAGVYILNKQRKLIQDSAIPNIAGSAINTSVDQYQKNHVAEGEDDQCNKCVEDQAISEVTIHLEE